MFQNTYIQLNTGKIINGASVVTMHALEYIETSKGNFYQILFTLINQEALISFLTQSQYEQLIKRIQDNTIRYDA